MASRIDWSRFTAEELARVANPELAAQDKWAVRERAEAVRQAILKVVEPEPEPGCGVKGNTCPKCRVPLEGSGWCPKCFTHWSLTEGGAR